MLLLIIYPLPRQGVDCRGSCLYCRRQKNLHFVFAHQCSVLHSFGQKQKLILELTEVAFNKLLYDILRFILSI